MRTLFCNSSYGTGGIGQHLAHLVEEFRHDGTLTRYYAPDVRHGDPLGVPVSHRTYGLLTYTPIRFSPGWRSHVANELFDRQMARRLPADGSLRNSALMGFAGKSLHTFRRGHDLGANLLELVAPNSHVENVARLHARAATDTGIRDSWLNDAQRRKTLREYALADRIYVHSEYVRQSFLDAGISRHKLVRTHLISAPRFRPPPKRPPDDTFRIAYVGRVEMTKGIALLLDACEQLPFKNAELTLVGGWSTRAGRRFVQKRLAQNPCITLAPGDPLPVLHRADVFVHPSYEDGFGYAPMEALACGVPVIVTDDTGMKEYVRNGINGYVVPTGSLDALLDALESIHDTPLVGPSSLLPNLHDGAVADVH